MKQYRVVKELKHDEFSLMKFFVQKKTIFGWKNLSFGRQFEENALAIYDNLVNPVKYKVIRSTEPQVEGSQRK